MTANNYQTSKDVVIFMFSWCLEANLSCRELSCFIEVLEFVNVVKYTLKK